MTLAIVRQIAATLARAEVTHIERVPVDVDAARTQHARYHAVLSELGCRVHALPADERYPDCVFIEDTAIVLDELAVLTRPGADSRRGETAAVAPVLAERRQLRTIDAPGTLDGGDVLVLGRRVLVGRTARSDDAGIRALADLVTEHGYEVVPVDVQGCLHLKTACCALAADLVLVNPAFVDVDTFAGCELIIVDEREPFAANALALNGRVIYPEEHVRTADALRARGCDLALVPNRELAKLEGGVTCCSLIVPAALGSRSA